MWAGSQIHLPSPDNSLVFQALTWHFRLTVQSTSTTCLEQTHDLPPSLSFLLVFLILVYYYLFDVQARNLGISLDVFPSLTSHIQSISKSCQFSFPNIPRIHPILTVSLYLCLPMKAIILSCLCCYRGPLINLLAFTLFPSKSFCILKSFQKYNSELLR